MPDVVVIGGICHDFFCYVDRFPNPGESVVGYAFRMGSGGKGASAGTMAGQLGASVSMIGMVGVDIFGQMSIESMKTAGVETKLISRTQTSHTATASITVDSNGENAIVAIFGANTELSSARILELEAEIAGSRIVLCQYEIPHETNLTVFELARKYKVPTFLNAAPSRPELKPTDPLMSLTDIICTNQGETEVLIGEALHSLSDFKSALPKVLALGPRIAIITLGGEGALIGSRTADGQVEITKIDAPRVDVVDTTGAGDCFCGAFAYFYLQTNGNFVLAAEKAVQVSALSVTKQGNQDSYPTADLLHELGIL